MSHSHEERIFLGASCRAIGLGHSGQHYTNDTAGYGSFSSLCSDSL